MIYRISTIKSPTNIMIKKGCQPSKAEKSWAFCTIKSWVFNHVPFIFSPQDVRCRPVDLSTWSRIRWPSPTCAAPASVVQGPSSIARWPRCDAEKSLGCFGGSLHGIASGKLTYIYMENGPNRNRWFIQIVIFNSHVKLPEGNPLVILTVC